jgi:hypothetical protein
MTPEEIKSIIEASGLSIYKAEKRLRIPNGTLGRVIKGEKELSEAHEKLLRAFAPAEVIEAGLAIDKKGEPELTPDTEILDHPDLHNKYPLTPEESFIP